MAQRPQGNFLARLWIEQRLASRFLAENPLQTLLISVAIAVGITVIIFITTIINGLQQNMIDRVLGSQAHVKLEATRLFNRTPSLTEEMHRLVLETQRAQPLQRIENWQEVLVTLEEMGRFTAVSPIVTGAMLVQQGRAVASVVLNGIDEPRYRAIVNLEEKLVAGRHLISSQDVMVGSELAKELGINAGDKIRLQGTDNRSALVRVAGIFELGVQEADSRFVYIDIKRAQTLLNLPGGITGLEMKVEDVFQARAWGQRLERLTGLHMKNWMDNNSQLLNALDSQRMTTQLIRFFVAVSVAFGIASVLAVTVVQRTREVGILRAMGSTRAQVMRVFLMQGVIIGVLGASLGLLGATALVAVFNHAASSLFTVQLESSVALSSFALAVFTGLLAAVLPARRAAMYDPVEAIRYV
ncbi:MAG TPA: ABC transporter permease [Alcanivoracaceae bacterium]|nr:ABC transporter permease [Alcanivoracaceae bacterium]